MKQKNSKKGLVSHGNVKIEKPWESRKVLQIQHLVEM